MTVRNLGFALHPQAVAVVGGGPLAARVSAGLEAFAGPVWAVDGARDVAELSGAPELAVVTAPAEAVPAVIAALGSRGCKVAVVLSEVPAAGGLRQAMLDAARPHLLRVIGPGSDGLIVPGQALVAGVAPAAVAAGELALVSQSGTIAAALVERAADHGIGLSCVVSLGAMADVDVGDCLDLLAADGRTRAILLYLESVPSPRKFLSAARAAARVKPVLALKAGRTPLAALAAATHTGRLAGEDAVVEAALARAGVLRVEGLAELFEAAETLARFRPMRRARLAIVTNSGGGGVLAVDRLDLGGGTLAELAPETAAALDAALPTGWSGANPVDLGSDAPPEAYAVATAAVAADKGVDAVLAMNAPGGAAAPVEAAQALSERVEAGHVGRKPVLACWMGGAAAREGRTLLRTRGVAGYHSPAGAVAAVGHLTDWGRLQEALLRVPDRGDIEAAEATAPEARERVAAIFAAVAAEGRRVLKAPEAEAVLAAYGIPSPELRVAATPEAVRAEAAAILRGVGRVAVKLLSIDVGHKSDVGGVVLEVATPEEAEAAARGIAERAEKAPGVRVEGFGLQPMVRRPLAQELIVGLGRDAIFGPVILFGAGGIAVELMRDTAVALPPLDAGLADELVGRTRVGRLLQGFRGRPPADARALQRALIALSHLVEDFPCLRAIDVNPLLADADGVLALDVWVEIDPADRRTRLPNPDLVIRPYPAEWRRSHSTPEGVYALRPIRPADALLYPAFMERIEPEDIRMRFMAPRRQFPPDFGLRMSQLDYDREMAFVAIAPDQSLAGVSRLTSEPDRRTAEYSLLVRSDLNGRGLGTALMRILIDYARADGLARLEGIVLAENRGMRRLVEGIGFAVAPDPDDPGVVMSSLAL